MAPVARGCCVVLAWRKGSCSAPLYPRLDPGPRGRILPASSQEFHHLRRWVEASEQMLSKEVEEDRLSC